jgi:hypothetical protein
VNEPNWQKYIQKPYCVKAFQATEKYTMQTLTGTITLEPTDYLIEPDNGQYEKLYERIFNLRYKSFDEPI